MYNFAFLHIIFIFQLLRSSVHDVTCSRLYVFEVAFGTLQRISCVGLVVGVPLHLACFCSLPRLLIKMSRYSVDDNLEPTLEWLLTRLRMDMKVRISTPYVVDIFGVVYSISFSFVSWSSVGCDETKRDCRVCVRNV